MRSRMNDNAVVADKPSVHHVDYLLDGVKTQRRKGVVTLKVWGHDHDGAYRQLMNSNPFWTMCILVTAFGLHIGHIQCSHLGPRVRFGPMCVLLTSCAS